MSEISRPGSGLRLTIVAAGLLLLPILISVGLYYKAQSSIAAHDRAGCARTDAVRDIVKRQAADKIAGARDARAAARLWVQMASGNISMAQFLRSDAALRLREAARQEKQAHFMRAELVNVRCTR